MWDIKCGIEECEFTPNLKSLISRFLSIESRHFLLIL